ncbi:MAG TPA: nucleotidyltransferase domain-containing protein, partial [Polyangiaceae bacterium]
LGDDLVGVLVHGSVVRGEYRAGESDVDVVIVLTEAKLEALRAMSDAVRLARYAARIEAMILTEEEIAGAADAFPLMYDEIKRHHLVLAGRNPFEKVEVLDRHRRLRIEQELREAQIRLRRQVTDSLDQDALARAILGKTKQIRSPLAALLALKGVATEPELAKVIAAAGKTWSVATDKLAAARESPDAAHAALSELLDKAIAAVNAMEEK